jgi:HD-like signal output (HDOD) protein/nitrogen-specific signal transduction histidine kinase
VHRLPQPIIDALEAADVPPLPQILFRLLQAVEDEGVTCSELAAIVDKDPALSARMLAAANSVAFRRPRPVLSIEACLQSLGIRVVKSIATCLAVKRLFEEQSRRWHADLSGFWRHSLLTADIARSLAIWCGYHRPEEAYLAGLLHDVGELLMLTALRDRYSGLVAVSDSEATLVQLETQQLGTAHNEVGAWLIDQWHLDEEMADSILFHHEPQQRIVTAEHLPRLVWLANACTAGEHSLEEIAVWGNAMLNIDFQALHAICTDAEQRMRAVATAMEISLPPEEVPAAAADCLPKGAFFDREPATRGEDALRAAVGGRALLQPLQDIFRAAGNEAELLVSLRESARILFGVGRLAYLFVDEVKETLCGAQVEGQPGVFQNFERHLAEPRSLAAQALLTGEPRSSFEGVKLGALSLVDVQFARALGSEGLLCLPLAGGKRGLGVVVMGLSTGQFGWLSKRPEWLTTFALVASASIRTQREARQRETVLEETVAARYSCQAHRTAHEAGNPLGIIKSYLKLLDAKLPETLGLRSEMTVLREEIDRVSSIIQRMAGEPQKTLRRKGVDINAIIQELAALYGEPLFRGRNIELALDLDSQEPLAHGDRDAIKQILVNLLKNASEAMPVGGRAVVASRAGITMDAQSWHEVSVEDSGPGLPLEAVQQLYGAEPAVGASGRGIGLSIVSSLAAHLGAKFSCRVRDGKGTRIAILLPAEMATPVPLAKRG